MFIIIDHLNSRTVTNNDKIISCIQELILFVKTCIQNEVTNDTKINHMLKNIDIYLLIVFPT